MSITNDALARYRQMIETSAIRALIALDVFDTLPQHDQSMTLEELADRTGTHRDILQRLLRVVASTGVVQFDSGTGAYSHTEISKGYCSNQPSTDFFVLMYDEVERTAVVLPDWFKQHGRAADPAGLDSLVQNPCTFRHESQGKTFFEIMATAPGRVKAFQRGMSAMDALHPFEGVYDFSALSLMSSNDPDRTLFVDVGGGDGTFLRTLLAAHPSLPTSRLVLQDVPSVIDVARKDLSLPSDIVFQSHDFHFAQPVRGAHVYHIRACLHDYGDVQCTIILSHIANAMATDSLLLIAENIMPEHLAKDEVIGVADVTMMLFGGRERTENDWKRVLGTAGLTIKRIFRADRPLTWSVMEVGLHDDPEPAASRPANERDCIAAGIGLQQ